MDDYTEAGLEAGRECLMAALDYLRRGWSVLALCPPDHVGVGREHVSSCGSPGKAPWYPWKEYQQRLPTEAEVREWWRVLPNANVGCVLGQVSGMIGIDVDGPLAEAKLLEISGGDLPPTLWFHTPGGGRRLLYTLPRGLMTRSQSIALGPGQELRFLAEGSLTVLPPSRHYSGGRYGPAEGVPPFDQGSPVAPPAWLTDDVAGCRQAPRGSGGAGAPIPEGSRHDTLTSLAGSMRRRGMTEEEMLASLLVVNERCVPPWPEAEVRKVARSVARYAPEEVPGVAFRANGNGHASPHAGGPKPEPVLLRLAEVAPEPVRWLWPYWLPEGMIAMLDGDPSLGKSTLCLDLAARVTRGLRMPPDDGPDPTRAPGAVLWLGAEDSLKHTVRPRLDAAGADPGRVISLEGVRVGEDVRDAVLPWDLELVADHVTAAGVRLILVDPVMAFLGTEYDAHRDQDIRRCLRPLRDLAERLGVSILMLRHLNKLVGGATMYRGGGSIGILGAARSALIAGRDPKDDGSFVLAMNKTNIGPFPRSLVYRVEAAGMASRVVWVGETDLQAHEILWHHQTGQRAEGSADAEAKIRELLAEGSMPAREFEAALKAEGFSRDAIFRARKRLGVVSRKEGRFDGQWSVSLPNPAAEAGSGVPCHAGSENDVSEPFDPFD
jgi:AAA domain/Bifunctional DNA primase/polymerase, N-terminal/Primase C terminal 1 (PriCT-1)